MNDQESLIPWYLNESLSAKEQQTVESWLQGNPDTYFLQQTREIALIVSSQEVKAPDPRIESALLAKIRQPDKKPAGILQWAWSLPLAALLFIIMWVFVQPGTQLQWSTTGSDLAAFRVYRAPAGRTTFELLEEVPADSQHNNYQYVDETALIPGRTYHYVIEIVARNGSTAISPAVISNTLMNLSSQFAILLTSFMLTFGMITIVRELKSPLQF